jgi:hypothetical protein
LCITDPCSGNKYKKTDGKCYPCDAGTRPDETGLACKTDTCDDVTQIKDDLGYCITCNLFTKPNADNSACHPDPCEDNQKLKEDGTCEDCDEYFHPDTTGKICVQCDMTGREREIWTQTGECSTCPDYTYPGPNKKECIKDICDELRDYLKPDGTCHTCEDYTKPNPITQTCDVVDCGAKSKKKKDGTCEECPEGWWGDWNG